MIFGEKMMKARAWVYAGAAVVVALAALWKFASH
jgi:hypothetical protein